MKTFTEYLEALSGPASTAIFPTSIIKSPTKPEPTRDYVSLEDDDEDLSAVSTAYPAGKMPSINMTFQDWLRKTQEKPATHYFLDMSQKLRNLQQRLDNMDKISASGGSHTTEELQSRIENLKNNLEKIKQNFLLKDYKRELLNKNIAMLGRESDLDQAIQKRKQEIQKIKSGNPADTAIFGQTKSSTPSIEQ